MDSMESSCGFATWSANAPDGCSSVPLFLGTSPSRASTSARRFTSPPQAALRNRPRRSAIIPLASVAIISIGSSLEASIMADAPDNAGRAHRRASESIRSDLGGDCQEVPCHFPYIAAMLLISKLAVNHPASAVGIYTLRGHE